MAGMQMLNFGQGDDAFTGQGGNEKKVHVRVQQRNGRKCVTTVAGLDDDLDVKRICKAMRKTFACNGSVTKDKATRESVIQLQGDQRGAVKEWLTFQKIYTDGERIVLHGH